MPPLILAMIQGLPLLISAVKDAKPIYDAARAAITAAFQKGAITAEQQNRLHSHVDALEAAALSGETPPEFTVEADPAAPAAPAGAS